MAKQSKTSTVAIQNLLEEKRQIERWLRRLDMASDKTPSHVKTKVQGDYARRRDAILEELQGFRDELNSGLQRRRVVRDDLAKKEEDATESLAEAELRHTVGEYDADKWSTIRAEILESLVKIREELKVEQAEITNLEEVLDAIDGSAGDEREAEAEEEPEPADLEAQAAPEVARNEESEGARAPGSKSRGTDEMAFLRSVISGARSATGLSGKRNEEDNLAEIAEKDQADQLGTAGVSPVNETPPPAKGSARKSVKCTDCGTLNLPTEWYCEKCGAELTAL
jgi:hypothetical protein